jgi:hypothetical protein
MPGENHSGSTDKNEHVRTHGYGPHGKTEPSVETVDPEDVFEDPTRPRRKEAISALVDAGFLSSLEAEAYVRQVIERQSPVEEHSFSLTCVKSAKEKITAARESFNILEAYRFPQPPEECSRCGADLGEVWAANLVEISLCLDCAEVERPDLNP